MRGGRSGCGRRGLGRRDRHVFVQVGAGRLRAQPRLFRRAPGRCAAAGFVLPLYAELWFV